MNKHIRSLNIVKSFHPEVEEVVDATEDLHITVTDADNRAARKKDHSECAMAVACKSKEQADGVIISVRSAYVVKGNKAVRYRIPEATSREIVVFDRQKEQGGFEPGVYVMKRPAPSERLGNKQSGKTRNPSDRKSPKFVHTTANIRTSLRHVS